MSTTVVPAPADEAKRPVRSEKLAKQSEKQQAVQEDEERLAEDDSEEEVGVAESNEASAQEASLADDFTFGAALASAAAASGSLITESEEAEEVSYSNYGDGGSEGTILLIGAVLLVGVGIAALASGGSDDPADDVPLNEDPTISADDITVDEDGTGTVTVTTADADGDTVTVTASAANGMVTDNGDGTFDYTPDADFNGTDTITFTADDGNGGTASVDATVTITPVNDDPAFAADEVDIATDEDTPFDGDLADAASDVDGDDLTFALVTDAMNGSVVVDPSGTYTYTPDPDFNGDDVYEVSVSDGNGGTDTLTVNVTVAPVNDAPVAGPGATMVIETNQNVADTFTIDASDVDGDTITVTATEPGFGDITPTGDPAVFTYTPDAGFFGDDEFDITLDDGNGGTFTYTVSVTVNEETTTVESLDVGTNSNVVMLPASGDASDDAYTFTDDRSVVTNVEIENFGLDDVIVVSGVTDPDTYNFGTSGDDLEVTFNDGTDFTSIIIDLDDGLSIDGLVFDYDTAVAAVGFQFMTFG